MTFKEVLAQVIDWLQQDQRISYRALKRQFDLDDEYLEDLKLEVVKVELELQRPIRDALVFLEPVDNLSQNLFERHD